MSKKSAIQVEVVDENLLKMLLDSMSSLQQQLNNLQVQVETLKNKSLKKWGCV